MRIAVAGFQHETNTFSKSSTELTHFEMADSWPGLLEGEAVIADTHGMNLPIAGAIQAANDIEVVPILWCAAEPAGHVADQAFDWVADKIIDGISKAGSLDAIYLDLHGAMVTQSHEDGEGELLRRLRVALGDDIPIGVSLDLHANISAAMVDLSTLITVYRTYPHLDMAESGARCISHLVEVIQGRVLKSSFRQIPFLIPLHAQCTDTRPCRELYQRIASAEKTDYQWAELALGFTAADIHDCGPSVLCYSLSSELSDVVTDDIVNAVVESKSVFDTRLYNTDEAVSRAIKSTTNKPVLIADVQDNPGAGGTSDTTGLLQSLITAKARGAVLGVMCDPTVANSAHQSGVGAVFQAALDAGTGLSGHRAIDCECQVLSISDGKVTYTGEMYGGGVATLGQSCLLSVGGPACDIKVVVSSSRIQCLDRALFTHFGIDLQQTNIICVKSTVHYRADFEPLCSEIMSVAVPGVFSCAPNRSDYQNLRPDISFLGTE